MQVSGTGLSTVGAQKRGHFLKGTDSGVIKNTWVNRAAQESDKHVGNIVKIETDFRSPSPMRYDGFRSMPLSSGGASNAYFRKPSIN